MSTYSRRQLHALGMPLGESSTRVQIATPIGRTLIAGGGGSSGPSTTESTVTNYNVPEWLRPQTEALVGAATQELFQTDGNNNITGVKPYTPYSANPQDYVAGFSPLQEQAFGSLANMTYTPTATGPQQFATYQSAYNPLAAAAASGEVDMSTIPGGLGVMTAPKIDTSKIPKVGTSTVKAPTINAPTVNRGDIGTVGTFDVTSREMDTPLIDYVQDIDLGLDPTQITVGSIEDYMSPYMQNVVDVRKNEAITDAQKANLANNLAATRQGTYGGARQLLAQMEREHNLQSVMDNIQATGSQAAYEQAMQAQQYYSQLQEQARQADNQLEAQAQLEQARQVAERATAQANLTAQMEQAQATNDLIAQQVNAGHQLTASQINAANDLAVAQSNAQMLLEASMANAANALTASQANAANKLAASQANAANQLAAAQMNAQLEFGAAQTNIQAGIAGSQLAEQARQFDVGASSNDLANQLALAQAQFGAGSAQQANQQAAIDAAINNYSQAQNNAVRNLEAYNSLLHGYSTPSVTQTRDTPAPSAASQLAGLGTTAAGLYGAMGNKEGGLIRKPKQGIDTLAIRKASTGSKK